MLSIAVIIAFFFISVPAAFAIASINASRLAYNDGNIRYSVAFAFITVALIAITGGNASYAYNSGIFIHIEWLYIASAMFAVFTGGVMIHRANLLSKD